MPVGHPIWCILKATKEGHGLPVWLWGSSGCPLWLESWPCIRSIGESENGLTKSTGRHSEEHQVASGLVRKWASVRSRCRWLLAWILSTGISSLMSSAAWKAGVGRRELRGHNGRQSLGSLRNSGKLGADMLLREAWAPSFHTRWEQEPRATTCSQCDSTFPQRRDLRTLGLPLWFGTSYPAQMALVSGEVGKNYLTSGRELVPGVD